MDIIEKFEKIYLNELQSLLPEGVDVIIEGDKIYLKIEGEIIMEEGLQAYHKVFNDDELHSEFFGEMAQHIEDKFFKIMTKAL